MTNLDKLRNFYLSGTDPEFTANPNHVFMKDPIPGERTFLVPGHFYTHLELNPIGSDSVPTWDEYEILKNPSLRDLDKVTKYPVTLPYYDNRPIFLALSQDGLGINLKIMSQLLRKQFIRTYLKQIAVPLEKCYSDGKLIDFSERLRLPEIRPLFGVNLPFIKAMTGFPDIKFNLLVNKYNRERMRNLTLIDWDDVPKLHLANYSTDKSVSTRSAFSLFEIK